MTWSVSSSCSELSNSLFFYKVHEKITKDEWSFNNLSGQQVEATQRRLTDGNGNWPRDHPRPRQLTGDRIWNYPGAHYPVHTHWATDYQRKWLPGLTAWRPSVRDWARRGETTDDNLRKQIERDFWACQSSVSWLYRIQVKHDDS